MSREGDELKGRGKRGGTKSLRAQKRRPSSRRLMVTAGPSSTFIELQLLLVQLTGLYRVQWPTRTFSIPFKPRLVTCGGNEDFQLGTSSN